MIDAILHTGLKTPDLHPYTHWLRRHRYKHVAKALEEGVNPSILNALPRLSSPILLEQLIVFDRALPAHPLRKQILDYGIGLSCQDDQENSFDEMHNADPHTLRALLKLGILTYWIERNPRCLDTFDANATWMAQLETSYQRRLEQVKLQLHEMRETHRGGIQNAQSAVMAHAPHIVAADLLTEEGWLNIGLIQPWISFAEQSKTNWAFTLRERLKQYFRSAASRDLILRMRIEKEEVPIHTVVRIALGLDTSTPLGNRHGRLAALAASLSHIRQSPSSNCFTLVICLMQLNEKLPKALEDFNQLLT